MFFSIACLPHFWVWPKLDWILFQTHLPSCVRPKKPFIWLSLSSPLSVCWVLAWLISLASSLLSQLRSLARFPGCVVLGEGHCFACELAARGLVSPFPVSFWTLLFRASRGLKQRVNGMLQGTVAWPALLHPKVPYRGLPKAISSSEYESSLCWKKQYTVTTILSPNSNKAWKSFHCNQGIKVVYWYFF